MEFIKPAREKIRRAARIGRSALFGARKKNEAARDLGDMRERKKLSTSILELAGKQYDTINENTAYEPDLSNATEKITLPTSTFNMELRRQLFDNRQIYLRRVNQVTESDGQYAKEINIYKLDSKGLLSRSTQVHHFNIMVGVLANINPTDFNESWHGSGQAIAIPDGVEYPEVCVDMTLDEISGLYANLVSAVTEND